MKHLLWGALLVLGTAQAAGPDPVALQQQCDAKDYTACAKLGNLYYVGQNVEKSQEKANALFKMACDAGNGLGCSYWGLMYHKGAGVEKSEQKAVEYYEKSCDQGISKSCNILGNMNRKGNSVVKVDMAKSAAFFKKACELKDNWGCWNYGNAFVKGWGEEKAPEKAEPFYKQAMEYSIAKCDEEKNGRDCRLIGLLHEGGLGTPVALDKAKQYYELSCQYKWKDGCLSLEKMNKK